MPSTQKTIEVLADVQAMLQVIFDYLKEELDFEPIDDELKRWVVNPNGLLPEQRVKLFSLVPKVASAITGLQNEIRELRQDIKNGVADINFLEDRPYIVEVTWNGEDKDEEGENA